STAWNVSYNDENGVRHDADLPFSLGIGGGTPLFRMLGLRGQLSYEHVDDKEFGSDTRLAVTGVLGTRSVEIARGLNVSLRGEGTSRFDGDSTYTWYRASAGLSVLP